jgi:diaminohydroxyphosphoribosylaminopyrimidine deaminase/5-amino-6-(5-phosphoribosylamino)uracil reductase
LCRIVPIFDFFPVETQADDALYMARALELALLGRGYVSPNPMVGCVVVHHGQIIGEGWHQRFGEAHAEVNAIQAVTDKTLLAQSTLYVNLEPCSHYGKTPPCADFIIKNRLRRVVIANMDTNPLVAGKGVQKLRNAGIEVITGVMEAEGKNLNKRFFTFMSKMRPYLILKWAETADGFIARTDHTSQWISNPLARKLVHKWRAEEDAVMVATHTALYDNPRLNVRDWSGRPPIRIVLDRELKLPQRLHLFDRSQNTLCYNLHKDEFHENLEYVRIREPNLLHHLIGNLYGRRIQSVMIEGGARLFQSLLDADLWDEMRIFRNNSQCFGQGLSAPAPKGALVYHEKIQDNDLLIFRREDSF